MANQQQGSNALFGLNGSNPGVSPTYRDNQSTASSPHEQTQIQNQALAEDGPSGISGDNYYNANPSWGYQGTPPYQPYDVVSTSAAPGAIFQTSPWDVNTASPDGLPASTLSQAPSIPAPAAIYEGGMSLGGQPSAGGQSSPIDVLTLSNEALTALTPAQREKLRNIAMPPHLQYHSPKSDAAVASPGSSRHGEVSSPENPDAPRLQSRKRKSSADGDDDDDEDGDAQPVKKTAHNMIEKRYRTNLNDKIAALRDSVPSLRIMSKSARGEDTTEDREELHGLTPAHKLNKATVLSKATEYIRHLEKRNVRLQDENSGMMQRILAFEKLFMAGAMNGALNPMGQAPPTPIPLQDGQRFMAPSMTTPPGPDGAPASMMQVPEDVKRILQAQMSGQSYSVGPQASSFQGNPNVVRQQQIQQQQQMQANRWRNNAPYYGKLMVGSLAGLMVLEAVREEESSQGEADARGLLALPVHLLKSFASNMNVNVLGHHFSASQVIWSLKLLAVLSLVLWLYVPSIFAPSDKKAKKAQDIRASLTAASLASPIHVRRQAWLTAVQTVWVPHHNFFLEAAALMLKTLKLSVRNAIGVRGFQMLTGLTEEQETARVKAWAIALDAQLAGGDVEINKPRLTLTLLASGTLPSTPLRLMLKALHIRLLLWELGSNPMQLGLVNLIAAKLARSKWNEARQMYLMKNRLGELSDGEDLPEHLALLLQQNCDDVLNDTIIQRAHNLAWNLPTRHNILHGTDGMDGVIVDEAVLSPMDAIAAWRSSQLVQTAVVTSLETAAEESSAGKSIEEKLNLAVKMAPIGSNVQCRAMAARAALSGEKREDSIRAAKLAAEPDSSGAVPADHTEIQAAIRCAVTIGHLDKALAEGNMMSSRLQHQSLRAISSMTLPASLARMSLLGGSALFQLMERLFALSAVDAETYGPATENLAGNLRIWIGSSYSTSENSLDQKLRHQMVERCLSIAKSVSGMEMGDPGYGSMSECEDSNEC